MQRASGGAAATPSRQPCTAIVHQRAIVRRDDACAEGDSMLSLDECIGMCGLTDDEVAIVAEHRRIPLMAAAQLGYALLRTPKGVFTLRSYFLDVLEQAKLCGKRDKARHVDEVLTRFNAAHPLPPVL
jgi:hypothetical protein